MNVDHEKVLKLQKKLAKKKEKIQKLKDMIDSEVSRVEQQNRSKIDKLRIQISTLLQENELLQNKKPDDSKWLEQLQNLKTMLMREQEKSVASEE